MPQDHVTPCPFCGSADLVFDTLMSEDEPDRPIARRILCQDCLTMGPAAMHGNFHETDDEAIQAWEQCTSSPQSQTDLFKRAFTDAIRILEIIQSRSAEQRQRQDEECPLLSAQTMAVIARDSLNAIRSGTKPAVLQSRGN